MISVQSRIVIYEIEGKAVNDNIAAIKVFSHWNNPSLVLIQINDEPTYTVLAKDLIAAVKNAENFNRF